MFVGSIVGLTIIYIVLTWVFKSWLRPITIMIMIPLSFCEAKSIHISKNEELNKKKLLSFARKLLNEQIYFLMLIVKKHLN